MINIATATFAVIAGTSDARYLGGLVSLVVMTLISSLSWFIIAGALRAFDHLITISEFTAEMMVNIAQSLQTLAAGSAQHAGLWYNFIAYKNWPSR
jgi:hypothetical protein